GLSPRAVVPASSAAAGRRLIVGMVANLHFAIVAVITAVVSGAVLWRFGAVVRRGMVSDQGETLPAAPALSVEQSGVPHFVEVDRRTPISAAVRAALGREAIARRRII